MFIVTISGFVGVTVGLTSTANGVGAAVCDQGAGAFGVMGYVADMVTSQFPSQK